MLDYHQPRYYLVMPFQFSKYVLIKKKYCILYVGVEFQFIEQLLACRSYIEQMFPEIEIHICCKDSFFHLIENERNTTSHSIWMKNKRNYGYTRELVYNRKTNPVNDLLEESKILIPRA